MPSRSKHFIVLIAALAAVACDDPGGLNCNPNRTAGVRITSGTPRTLTIPGDTVHVRAAVLSECGDTLQSAPVAWTSSNTNVALVTNGIVTAVTSGTTVVRATAATFSDSTIVTVVLGPSPGTFTVIGLGAVAGFTTTELWVHGDHAYTGTTSGRVYTFRIFDNAAPVLVDSITLEASIGDLQADPDGRFLYVALQGGLQSSHGVVILSLANPAKPTFERFYSTGLERGVHTLWYERISGRNYVFAAENGSISTGGYHILDVTNHAAITEVEHFYGGTSFAHDVYVRDGLAFLSHWNAGMIILDVGNGVRGGTPDNPVEVSRIITGLNSVHNIWYWPARKLAFIGEERVNGRLQVIDLANLAQPRLIAYYEIANGVPHNFWMDEDAGLLYAAWYTNGVRVFDVTAPLAGNIAAREVGFVTPIGPRGQANIWGPQLHRGVVYAADMSNGLWALRFTPGLCCCTGAGETASAACAGNNCC